MAHFDAQASRNMLVLPLLLFRTHDTPYCILSVIYTFWTVCVIKKKTNACCFYGKWFLPCGMVDPGETITHAAIRETREEANVEAEILSLVAVEENGPTWIRFNFLARHVSGTPKDSRVFT